MISAYWLFIIIPATTVLNLMLFAFCAMGADPIPKQKKPYASASDAMICPPYPCKGATPELCAMCRQERKPFEIHHA